MAPPPTTSQPGLVCLPIHPSTATCPCRKVRVCGSLTSTPSALCIRCFQVHNRRTLQACTTTQVLSTHRPATSMVSLLLVIVPWHPAGLPACPRVTCLHS